ncbi:MAG: response regulator [Candidatus Omnitrophica bacterium]|nr:response regulator [Candidatus Omnitrophota bacterium]
MPKTILICDIEENTREALKTILLNHANLIVVENPLQCLSALKQKAPVHLAFVGVRTEDGFDTHFFEEIRKIAPQIPLIAMGDHKCEEETLEAVRMGATGYMIKPFKAEEVQALAQKDLN